MIDPTEIPNLWRIAHDRTEIPAGEFLEELAELEFSYDGERIDVTQQTLSNYVKRGWVNRKRVDTAPGGRGQTGYFERRELIGAIFAYRFAAKHGALPSGGERSAPQRLADMVIDIYDEARAEGLSAAWLREPHYDDRNLVLSLLERAFRVRFLALLLSAVPTKTAALTTFAPDHDGRNALVELRKRLASATQSAPITADEFRDGSNGIRQLVHDWLASTPSLPRKASRAA